MEGHSIFASWEKLRPHLLADFSNLEELATQVSKLSNIFISRNSELKTYADDARLASAYAAFYMPGHWSKWDFLWQKLPHSVQSILAQNDLIDWGAGPGTYSLRWALDSSRESMALAVEQGQGMSSQGIRLATALGVEKKIHWKKELTALDINGVKKDYTWIFGHSLNEAQMSVLQTAMKIKMPLMVMAIEPVLEQSWNKVIALRTLLLEHGYSQVYPCPQASGECPSKSDGLPCHQVVRTQLPFWLEQAAQLAMINRRDLAMIAHVWLLNDRADFNYPKARVVHSFAPLKYGFRYQVCIKDEDEINRIQLMEELKRGLSRVELDQRLAITAGDGLGWVSDKGNRIKVTSIS